MAGTDCSIQHKPSIIENLKVLGLIKKKRRCAGVKEGYRTIKLIPEAIK